jgi:MFS family permease
MGESRAILFLSIILSFRMLGLFMIYPVFAAYASSYHHANVMLTGIALGAYGLTQALFQLPLSILSDRIGRKPVIYGGLLVFALGSILSAITNNIYCLILGRALQGSGAIGSTLLAFCADITSNQNRTKAMAALGMTIGLSFALAMIIGPIAQNFLHLTGIFWLTSFLALIGILLLFALPTPHLLSVESSYTVKNEGELNRNRPANSQLRVLKQLITDKKLLILNSSVLLAHATLTAIFSIVPLLFSEIKMPILNQWKIYLPVLLGAFLVAASLLIASEKKNSTQLALLIGILLLGMAGFFFCFMVPTCFSLIIGLFLFFTGFSLLEALLPSLISKMAPAQHKGSAMGIFSSFQFAGIFLGGLMAGILRHYYENSYIFFIAGLLCIMWCIFLSVYFQKNRQEIIKDSIA